MGGWGRVGRKAYGFASKTVSSRLRAIQARIAKDLLDAGRAVVETGG